MTKQESIEQAKIVLKMLKCLCNVNLAIADYVEALKADNLFRHEIKKLLNNQYYEQMSAELANRAYDVFRKTNKDLTDLFDQMSREFYLQVEDSVKLTPASEKYYTILCGLLRMTKEYNDQLKHPFHFAPADALCKFINTLTLTAKMPERESIKAIIREINNKQQKNLEMQ